MRRTIATKLRLSMLLIGFPLMGIGQTTFSGNLDDYVFDLGSLFENDETFYRTKNKVETLLPRLESYKDVKYTTRQNLLDALDFLYSIRADATKMSQYGFLKQMVDNTQENRNLREIGQNILTHVNAEASGIEEAVRHTNSDTLKKWLHEDARLEKHKRRINKIIFKAPHTLPFEQQRILASVGSYPKIPYGIFKEIQRSLKGPVISLNGQNTRLSKEVYDQYKRHSEKETREKVIQDYDVFLGENGELYGKLLTERIKGDVTIAGIQGFGNGMDAIWYLLDGMPEGAYKNMIAAAHANTAVMERYIRIKTKLLQIPRFGYLDFYAPIKAVNFTIPIDEAMEIAINASGPFGTEYQENLRERLKSGLFHLAPMETKDKNFYGIFPAVGDGRSYSIMSYDSSFGQSSALMGAATLMMAWENIPEGMNSDTGDDPGIFANSLIYLGNLLHDDYMLRQSGSNEERIFILISTLERIWGRFYRYALVTEWEIQIQNDIINGQIPTGENLSENYYRLLQKYYPGITVPKVSAHEWMTYRVPFYSFEHQFWPPAMAGAATIYNKLKEGDRSGLRIMDVLGRSDLEMTYTLFAGAGIDMDSIGPYNEVFKLMSSLMDELEKEID